nr:zinc finger, CCHC-type [Tanacetum cinerariifolium]
MGSGVGGDEEWFGVRRCGEKARKRGAVFWREALCIAQCFKEDDRDGGQYLSTDMVVSDAPGNAIHCSARSNVAHNFIKLKEGIIYCIKNFVVHPNKEEYRIRKDDAFTLEFNGATTAQKYLAKAVGFAFRFYAIKPNDSVTINSIIESRDVIFDENRFSSVPRPSQKSLVIRTKDIGGSVVLKKVTEEVVQQPEPELKKTKRNRSLKDFRPDFQLYLIEGTMDEVSDQHFYCFNAEDDPKTFDEAMKFQDVTF